MSARTVLHSSPGTGPAARPTAAGPVEPPPPTILEWIARYPGRTKDGRPRWWAHIPWPGDDRHLTVTDTPPPEGWERPTEWVPDPTWPGAYIPRRREDKNDGG